MAGWQRAMSTAAASVSASRELLKGRSCIVNTGQAIGPYTGVFSQLNLSTLVG